jgi:O-methyltransferase
LAGDFWECGVYRGGTAALLAQILKDSRTAKKLYLFDSFEGMPATDPEKDWHKKGDFSDTSLDSVSASIQAADHCIFKKGFIPDTFAGLEDSRISFAHIDVDIYKSIMDSLDFIWPSLVVGGFIVFDDYGFKTCASARKAVDQFFNE